MHALSRARSLSVRFAHVRGLACAAVAQLGETAAAAAHAPSSSHHPAPPTEPLPTVAWSGAAVNSVKITGIVLREVSVRHIARLNQPVASTTLGLRPPHPPPPSSPQAGQGLGAVSIEGFGYVAHQMVQHLRPGLTVQLEGHLRQDRWADKETGAARSAHKVVVESLALVEVAAAAPAEGEAAPMAPSLAAAPNGQLDAGAAAAASAALQPAVYRAGSSSGSAADGGGGSAAPRVRGPLQSTPSSQRSYTMYQQEGKSFKAIAEERGVKQSTVLTHVFTEAALGQPLNWARAASELQIGPVGSPWLTCIELSEAVEAAAREQEGTPITQLTLGRIRRELENNVVTGAKLAALETTSPDLTATYGAIRFGVALVAQGLDPTELVQHAPSPLLAVTGAPPS